MNWEASEIVEQESDKFKRWIKESICIRSNTPTMNRDEGAYQLSPIWTQVISTPKPGGEGASTEWLCAFIAIINTFRSLFKASETFNVFQVLIKMADSHRNCQHQYVVKTGYVLRVFKSTVISVTHHLTFNQKFGPWSTFLRIHFFSLLHDKNKSKIKSLYNKTKKSLRVRDTMKDFLRRLSFGRFCFLFGKSENN